MTLKSRLHSTGLLQSPEDQRQLGISLALDDELLLTLFQKTTGHMSRPPDITAMNLRELMALQSNLESKGTLAIPITHHDGIEVDGEVRPIVFVAATDVDPVRSHHGEMSTMLYLRDHIQVARMMMELYLRDPIRYKEDGETGRQLLLSALHLMSTPEQLQRFNDAAKRGSEAGQEDWPHISFWFNDLQAEKPNGWRNKQDSFQMLAHLTLDAISRGFINTDELLGAHKQFLAGIIPLLLSVGFPRYESSGSWEENCARRTSVMAIETALLIKMRGVAQKHPALVSLAEDRETLDGLITDGLHEIGRRLPFESPDYPADSIAYRQADATLAYILLYDIPAELANARIPIGKEQRVMSVAEIEAIVLNELATLDDPATGGMIRYKGDSYQRVNFHTNALQLVIRAIKQKVTYGGVEPDLDEKQRLRGMLMPPGHEAVWLHPLGQLSAWAARRSLETMGDVSDRYKYLGAEYLSRLLGLKTSNDLWCTAIGGDNVYHTVRVPADKLPECYIVYQYKGSDIFLPSPHTPLNWAIASAREAIGLLIMAHGT